MAIFQVPPMLKKKKKGAKKMVSKEVTEFMPNKHKSSSSVKLSIQRKAEVVIRRPRQK
jgi:hypothetical protein